jgi:hypothetical protein
MLEPPDGQETWKSYFGERRPASVFRLFKRQLALERRQTEKLFDSLHSAVNTEIGSLEQRILAKLDEIDASVNLIAIELARQADESTIE